MRRVSAAFSGFSGRRAAIAAGIVCAVAAAGALGYRLGSPAAAPETATRITLAACGLHPAPAPIALPLARMFPDAEGVPITVGPIRHPGLDAALPVRLEPSRGAEGSVRLEGDTLVVSLDPSRPSEEIRLVCRYGEVARVEFRGDGLRVVETAGALSASASPSGS